MEINANNSIRRKENNAAKNRLTHMSLIQELGLGVGEEYLTKNYEPLQISGKLRSFHEDFTGGEEKGKFYECLLTFFSK